MSVHIDVILDHPPTHPPKKGKKEEQAEEEEEEEITCISILYSLTYSTMNNQFNNTIYNISTIQNMLLFFSSIKVVSIFPWKNAVVIRLSSSMCLTDMTYLQKHVTFCEYSEFHEFRRYLCITIVTYLERESIADLHFFLFIFLLNIKYSLLK